MKKVKLTTVTLAMLAGTVVAPLITNAAGEEGWDTPTTEEGKNAEESSQNAWEDFVSPKWDTETAKDGAKSEDAGKDAWEEATKPKTEEKVDTPTAEEGKDAEDAGKDAWEEAAKEQDKAAKALEVAKDDAFKELKDLFENGQISYEDSMDLTAKINNAKSIDELKALGFLKETPKDEAWDTPTGEEGKDAEDAGKDAWEEAAKPKDDSKTDDSKTDDSKTDDSKTDDSKTDDSKTDDSKTDDSKVKDSKVKSSKPEAAKADDKKLPQTNEAVNNGLIFGGLTSMLTAAFLFFKKNK